MKTLMFATGIMLTVFLASCSKKSDAGNVEKSLSGTYELRSVSGMSGTNDFTSGNGNLFIFRNGRYRKESGGMVENEGTFFIVKEKAKQVNYCQVNQMQPEIEDYDIYFLQLEQEMANHTITIDDLPGRLRIYKGCSYNDSGFEYIYEKISDSQ